MEKKSNNISLNDIIFRQATLEDVDQILTFDSLDPVLLFTRTKLESEISNSIMNFCKVATYQNQIVGYSSMSIMYDHADILYVSVSKYFRRIGIAKKLIHLLIERCIEIGLKSIFLEVRNSNIAAISLYQNCGFQKISERKDYYSLPTETAAILKRNI